MPKTFPIRIGVEEFALGAVLRKLHEMQGVAKIDLDLGQGGHKPVNGGNGHGAQETILAQLMGGPKHRTELVNALGSRTRLYGAMNLLKGKKMVKAIGQGNYALTDTARRQLNGGSEPKALPAPAPAAGQRASRGASMHALITLLTVSSGRELRPNDIGERLEAYNVSSKSLS